MTKQKVITPERRWAVIKGLMDDIYGYGSGERRVHGLTHIKIEQTDTGYRFVPLDEAWRRFHTHKMPNIKSSAFSELYVLVERILEMNRKMDELVHEMYEYCKVFKDGKFEEEEDDTPERIQSIEEVIAELQDFRKYVEDWMKEKEKPEYEDSQENKNDKKPEPPKTTEDGEEIEYDNDVEL